MDAAQFRELVDQTTALNGACQAGLQALDPRDRQRVAARDPKSLLGSVNLDAALKETHPDDPRWDYLVASMESTATPIADWIEVHPANSHHVDEVIRKLRWLKPWLTEHAPDLAKLHARHHWIASGPVALLPNSPQRKKLAAAGIRFAGKHLRLPPD